MMDSTFDGMTRMRGMNPGLAAVAAAAALLAALVATPATAQSLSAQECYAEASIVGFDGRDKSGYASSYNAAYAACIARQGRYAGYNPPKVRVVVPIAGNCPPNAPVFYRGTLYCR